MYVEVFCFCPESIQHMTSHVR